LAAAALQELVGSTGFRSGSASEIRPGIDSTNIYKQYLQAIFTSNKYKQCLQVIFTRNIYKQYLQAIFTSNIYKQHLQATFTSNIYKQYLQAIFTSNNSHVLFTRKSVRTSRMNDASYF
jgi:ubiquitin